MNACDLDICKCETLNPLLRDGTSQSQRFLDTLAPDYVKVDERSFEDLIIFAYKYSKHLRFINNDNNWNGIEDWNDLFGSDICFLLSEISNFNYENMSKTNNESKEKIEFYLKLKKEQVVNNELYLIINSLRDYFKIIDKWYSRSIDEISIKKDIKISIESVLSNTLSTLADIDYSLAKVLTDWQAHDFSGFGTIWNFDTYGISNFPGIKETQNYIKNIDAALLQTDKIFEIIYGEIRKYVFSTPRYFTEALNKYPAHEPHYALFLAFLMIFKYAQTHINTITRSHLEFYYKNILNLSEKPAQPDKVHLLFKLAKNISKYSLAAGSELKAGKDSTGVELIYKTEKDIVVNNATVDEIKTIFLDVEESDAERPVEHIYSAAAANTADGAGTAFETEDSKWKTFGCSQENIAEGSKTMADANIGFAIASPQLYLAEGNRYITVEINFESENFDLEILNSKLNDDSFEYYLSGQKKWIKPTKPEGTKIFTPSRNRITFSLFIAAGEPAVTAYNATVLGNTFNTTHPLLKILMTNNPSNYEFIKKLSIKSIIVSVEAKEIRSLLLHNDMAKLNPAKPFMPFGPSPVLGSALYVGSQEIFNKKLSELTANIKWMGLPDTNFATHYTYYTPSITTTRSIESTPLSEKIPSITGTLSINNTSFLFNISVLDNTVWETLDLNVPIFNEEDFTGNEYESPYLLNKNFTDRPDEYESFTDFSHDLRYGFVKFELAGKDFQHSKYNKVLTTQIANDKTNLPNPPYTPVIKEFTLDYKSTQTFEDNFEQLFHILPFGEVEINFSAQTTSSKKIITTKTLLPTFTIDGIEKQGFLFLGLSDFVPPANLSLLFKVAEGSGDTEAEQPEVEWYYVSDNCLKLLKGTKIISDATDSLTTTGIIELDIPSDATNDDTLLTKGKHWICAAVNENADKVCELIDVDTQAVTAVFNDNGNDPEYLAEALTQGKITKFKNRIPEIKSVSQPYASFDGEVKESASAFYQRVSERLRHKNRAVTIWDYERIVLEKFPEIYKVKCINHTNSLSEIAPGSVTIVPISNLRNQNSVDLLKPKTTLNTLLKIKEYLTKLISKQINLEVENPFYEEIKTDFSVEFRKGYDKGYYAEQLNTEIIKHLSPWAYNEGADITFGGKIHPSFIINFIEEREYVDYITDFKMYHIVDGKGDNIPVEVAGVTSSLSILVSASKHIITIIKKDDD